jgi:non-ribosomal peptide synthetase component F
LRSDLSDNPTFRELLQQIKKTTLEAYDNQEVSFEKVVEVVVRQRDTSRSPLYQVMFALNNTPDIPELRLGELSFSNEVIPTHISKFDMTVILTDTSDGMQGVIEYCTDLYKEQTMDRLIDHFKDYLFQLLKIRNRK